jgi:hypothetical protein
MCSSTQSGKHSRSTQLQPINKRQLPRPAGAKPLRSAPRVMRITRIGLQHAACPGHHAPITYSSSPNCCCKQRASGSPRSTKHNRCIMFTLAGMPGQPTTPSAHPPPQYKARPRLAPPQPRPQYATAPSTDHRYLVARALGISPHVMQPRVRSRELR